MKPYPLAIPTESLIATGLDRIDYEDAFAVDVPVQSPDLLVRMPSLFFKVFPSWFRGLLHLREAIAKVIGLKTATKIDVEKQLQDFKGQVGDSIAVFHVKGRSETEILTSESDRHLDFCLSFFAIPTETGTQLILATTVQFNAWLGKVYFIPVGPIHRFAVPLILKRMAKALIEEEQTNMLSTT